MDGRIIHDHFVRLNYISLKKINKHLTVSSYDNLELYKKRNLLTEDTYLSLNKNFFSSLRQEDLLKLINFEQLIIDYNMFNFISKIEEESLFRFLRNYKGNIQTIRLSKKLNSRVVMFHFNLFLIQVDLDNLIYSKQQYKFLKKVLLNKIKKCEIKSKRIEKSFWAGLGSLKNMFGTKFEIKTQFGNESEIAKLGLEVAKKEIFSFVKKIKIYIHYFPRFSYEFKYRVEDPPKRCIFYSLIERSNCQLCLFDRFSRNRNPIPKRLRKQIPFIFE